jgi:putative transposase
MKLEISVPEVVNIFKEIKGQPDQLYEMIRTDIRETIGQYLSSLMDAELTHFLGRKRYERLHGDVNHRNGAYERNFTLKGIGEVDLQVPRDRKGNFKTKVIPKSKRYEDALRQDLCLMFLTGISTRSLSMISKKLIGRKISAGEVSNVNKELMEAAEKWRTRDLSEESIKYIFVDGVCFDMRIGKTIESVPVLAAIGVKKTGQKLVLGLQAGDKESASSWREFFKDLKSRGLGSQEVALGIMDGLPGLERVFKEEFTNAEVQRCQVHVARNVLAKVPKKFKKAVADDLRSIFYASSKKKAKEFFAQFADRWKKDLPSAVKCLDTSIDACLTFFNFPEEEWISLRTTNIIERLNKDLKMELHWRSNPIGKVRNNLPFFKESAFNDFTQLT